MYSIYPIVKHAFLFLFYLHLHFLTQTAKISPAYFQSYAAHYGRRWKPAKCKCIKSRELFMKRLQLPVKTIKFAISLSTVCSLYLNVSKPAAL